MVQGHDISKLKFAEAKPRASVNYAVEINEKALGYAFGQWKN